MKPMLAKKYADYSSRLTFPLYVQPKLNGVRALYHNGEFQSRDEHFWNSSVVAHFAQEIANLPGNIILDGEFYLHNTPLQTINGAISINRKAPSDFTHRIQYHVFDCLNINQLDLPFVDRCRTLEAYIESTSNLSVFTVPTYEVHSPSEADHFFEQFKSLGYEGMMYRTNSPYGIVQNCGNKENRWPDLIKRKDWIDEDFYIVDVEEGEGKYVGHVGALVMRLPNGQTFTAGSGLSDMQRRAYMDAPPTGFYAKIRYEMLSIDGKPLKPTVIAVLD